LERTAVKSTNVASVGYEGDTLEVEFLPKGKAGPQVYTYQPVARAFFDLFFIEGMSAGKLVHDLRRDRSVTVERIE
jgi:hypothetical protein